jgi:hypothetical protein
VLWGERAFGVRRIQSLVLGLPIDSASARSYDPERLGIGWRLEHDLLTTIAELVDHSNRLAYGFNTKKGTRIPDPINIPRPGTKREKRKATPQEVRALLGIDTVIVRE